MHWTYDAFEAGSDLEQGDVVAPTEELRAVLADVHPHFCAEKYLGFAVATQSCDLVRRKGGAVKARHISIAVIRSLKEVLPRVLAEVAPPVVPGLFRASGKLDAKRFLLRLFDQNEQGLGLFYLQRDADLGLGEPSVVFLRVKVALRAEHYPVLMRARRGRLQSEFRGKFGWLLGNLYSRAAAPDWGDVEGGKKEVDSMVAKHLTEQIPGSGPTWVDDDLVDAGRSAGVVFEGRTPEDLLAELQKHRPKERIEQIIDVALDEVRALLEPDADQLRILRNKLLNSGALRKLARQSK